MAYISQYFREPAASIDMYTMDQEILEMSKFLQERGDVINWNDKVDYLSKNVCWKQPLFNEMTMKMINLIKDQPHDQYVYAVKKLKLKLCLQCRSATTGDQTLCSKHLETSKLLSQVLPVEISSYTIGMNSSSNKELMKKVVLTKSETPAVEGGNWRYRSDSHDEAKNTNWRSRSSSTRSRSSSSRSRSSSQALDWPADDKHCWINRGPRNWRD